MLCRLTERRTDGRVEIKAMPFPLSLGNANPDSSMAEEDGTEQRRILCFCSDNYCKNDTCSVVGGQCFHSVHSVKVDGLWEARHVYGCAFAEADRSQLQVETFYRAVARKGGGETLS